MFVLGNSAGSNLEPCISLLSKAQVFTSSSCFHVLLMSWMGLALMYI